MGFSSDSIDIINIENPRHLSMVFELLLLSILRVRYLVVLSPTAALFTNSILLSLCYSIVFK